MKIKMDKAQWSEKSKNSFNYDANLHEEFYEDIEYICIRCTSIAIFAGEQQKFSFEVEKNYIWQKRVLCYSCYQVLQSIKSKIADFRSRFSAEADDKLTNEADLKALLMLIRELLKFDRSKDSIVESQIIKLLGENTD